MRRSGGIAAVVLAFLLLAAPAGAQGQGRAFLDPFLAERLVGAAPSDRIPILVDLRGDDLPAPGEARLARVAEREERVLSAVPAVGLRVERRYRSLPGFSAQASPAAIQALLRHPDTVSVYLDRPVHATIAEGRVLVGADVVNGQGYTGDGVAVAVLDTGIDSDHPDLSDDLIAQHCFCEVSGIPCCVGGVSESGSAESLTGGHGTRVAGIVTSSDSADTGVAPDAEIVAVKILEDNGNGDFGDVKAGLDWVLTESAVPGSPVAKVRVVNLSLGDGGSYDDDAASPCTGAPTANSIAALHAAGIAVFVSSGNEGFDNGISYPACVPEAISVGGVYDEDTGSITWTACSETTAADKFVCHTNSGSLLDVLAPEWKARTSTVGGGHANFGGTSAAAPYAAAQAALLLEADPTLTPEEIRSLLKGHGPMVTNPDNGLSFRRSDVALALESVLAAVGSGDPVPALGVLSALGLAAGLGAAGARAARRRSAGRR